jgi:hypothetical protein
MNPKTHRSKGWIIYPTLQLGNELFIEPFLELLDMCKIRYSFSGQKNLIVTPYGDIRLFSLQTPKRFVGSELTFVGFDEFDVESEKNCELAFRKAIGRMRGCQNPALYIVTTPEGYKHTYRLFVEKKVGKLIQAKTTDNIYIPDSYIQSLRDNYDAVLLDQYLNGKFVNIATMRAYYVFDRKLHTIKNYKPSADDVHIGIDFNVDPMTCTFSEFKDGRLVVYDELYLRNSNTFRITELISERTKDKKAVYVYPDLTGRARKTSAAITDLQILQKAGFTLRGDRNPRVKDRVACVNNAIEKGRVVIDERCKYLIRDLEQVGKDTYGEIDKGDGMLTHISDGLGYKISYLFPIAEKPKWKAGIA